MDLCEILTIDRTWQAPPLPPAVLLYNRRLGICMRCPERPEGCWKAVEYSCQQRYQEAARRAAETGTCPVGKLRL